VIGNDLGEAPEPKRRWRLGIASRLVAAALSGVADALDDRRREEPPDVEEAPEPPDGRWLVLLDREDPSRSLVIVPHQVVTATGALTRFAVPPESVSREAPPIEAPTGAPCSGGSSGTNRPPTNRPPTNRPPTERSPVGRSPGEASSAPLPVVETTTDPWTPHDGSHRRRHDR
jgi:hypothetical protein